MEVCLYCTVRVHLKLWKTVLLFWRNRGTQNPPNTSVQFENCKNFETPKRLKLLTTKWWNSALFGRLEPGFCKLMAHLEPRYALRSRRFFSEVSLPALVYFILCFVHLIRFFCRWGWHMSMHLILYLKKTSDVSPSIPTSPSWLA